MIAVKTVTTQKELQQILALQAQNLGKNLSPNEAAVQGYVTAEYTLSFLAEMHQNTPSIIAKDGDQVVGYSLVFAPANGINHHLINDLILNINKCSYKDQQITIADYVLVGQLCVSKDYRGHSLSKSLYTEFKNTYSNNYKYCITDVASNNLRSLKAHEQMGFVVIDTLNYDNKDWKIILWDWTTK